MRSKGYGTEVLTRVPLFTASMQGIDGPDAEGVWVSQPVHMTPYVQNIECAVSVTKACGWHNSFYLKAAENSAERRCTQETAIRLWADGSCSFTAITLQLPILRTCTARATCADSSYLQCNICLQSSRQPRATGQA